jgi:hypothetical protein
MELVARPISGVFNLATRSTRGRGLLGLRWLIESPSAVPLAGRLGGEEWLERFVAELQQDTGPSSRILISTAASRSPVATFGTDLAPASRLFLLAP